MLYIYSLSLFISAGIIGAFSRTTLQTMGLVPNLSTGLLLILAVGSLYAMLQLLFMGMLRLYQPTKHITPLITEIASNASNLVLIPFILHISIPWPSSTLEKIAPLIFLGVFIALHLVAKLATFYAVHQGAPDTRRSALHYMGTAFVMFLFLLFFTGRWTASLDAARIHAPTETQSMALEGFYAEARIIPEGATLETTHTPDNAQTLTTRWANVNGGQIEKIYATYTLQGDRETLYETSLSIPPGGWGEIRVPNEFLPDNLHRSVLRWTRKREANWQRIFGLRPIVFANDTSPGNTNEIAVSGPFTHYERPLLGKPNVIVVLIDGLSANHLAMLGYGRDVTPALDRLGYTGLVFPNTILPQKDVSTSIQRLLAGIHDTGVSPSTSTPSIASALHAAGYSTIAFTEGQQASNPDVVFGSGVESGFELFNSHFDAREGSTATLTQARQWISRHEQIPFFMMLRLRDLETPNTAPDVKGAYPETGSPRPVDHFDNALAQLDTQLGSLLKYVRDHAIRKNTYILVTAPYGHDFSLHRSGHLLEKPSLRVPLILNGPGIRTGQVPRQVDMADIGATIADITGISYPNLVDGQSVR